MGKNPLRPDLASDVSPNNQWDPETSQSSMTDSGSSDHSKSPKFCIRGLQRLTDLICEGPPALEINSRKGKKWLYSFDCWVE